MRLRKEVISLVLAGSLVLGGVSYLPNADVTGSVASAADTKVVELPDQEFVAGIGDAFNRNLNGVKISEEETTFSFASITNKTATNIWDHPLMVLYSSDDGVLYDSQKPQANYKEYWVVRGDAYGWVGAINTNTADALAAAGIDFKKETEVPAQDKWIADNKAGVKAEGSVKLVDGKAVLTYTLNGVTSVSTVPVTAGKDVYVTVVGENCKVTDIKFIVPVEAPTETAVPSTEPAVSATPDATDSPVPTESPDVTDEPAPTQAPDDQAAPLTTLPDLDVDGFWGAQTAGQKINSKDLYFGFKNTTYATASKRFECPVAILFTSDDGIVNSTNYAEYWVVRGDLVGWDFAGGGHTNTNVDALTAAGIEFKTENAPGSLADENDPAWDPWVAQNKEGSRCEGSVKLVDGKAVLTLTVNGITSTSTVPVPEGKEVYLAFTGEHCKMSHIKFSGNQEEAKLTDEELNEDKSEPTPETQKVSISGVTAKVGAKKITGKVSVAGATVTVKINGKKAKKVTVNGKKFTATTAAKLKAGAKIVITAKKDGYEAAKKTITVKKAIKLSKVTAKKGAKKVTATVSVKKATVTVKINGKKAKKVKVSGKKVTATTAAKLKKGDKVTIKATKSNCTAATKKVTVK